MSITYPGSLITKTPVTPVDGVASGIWTLSEQAYWQAQNAWTAQSDPNFENVTLLLNGDGTNGAQNNTFLDSSTNNFTITRNGNTTQGSFSPYGNNWSNLFDGSTNYLQAPAGSAFAYGTGDFTVEGWFFNTAALPQYGRYIFAQTVSGTNYFLVYLGDGTGSNPPANKVAFVGNTGTIANVISGATTFADNTWNHFAVVRSAGVITVYLNGVGGTPVAYAGNFTNTTYVPTIGRYTHGAGNQFAGYLSNLRVTKTAVYTENFTPSTSPLTAITNTSLLACQSNRFRDASTNNFTITAFGTPSVQRFSPFNPTAPYSTSVIGGSGYFDGSGDYLTVADNAALNVGTGDFCIEGWFNRPSFSSGTDSDFFVGKGTNNFSISANSSRQISFAQYGVAVLLTSTSAVSYSAWNHIAVTRSGTTLRMFINGVQEASTTSSANFTSTTALHIGIDANNSAQKYTGWISNLRIVKGSAVYTSAFTPPTAPVTNITNTSLLTNFTNAGIPDLAMQNNLETVGNAQVSTSVKKYGTGSLAFDGTGDYLLPNFPNPDLTAFGSGNFTIEFWVYFNSTASTYLIYDTRPSGVNGLYPTIYFDSSAGYINYYASSAIRITGNVATASGSWHHVALCRSGTSTKLFINGNQSGSTYTDSNAYVSAVNRPTIGGDGNSLGSNSLNGYIDDLRITKGLARYTASFTPRASAFPKF